MARNIINKTQTKAIITENVSDQFSSVYTNDSGEGAELVSVNINGTADSSVITEDTGANEWTYFGSHMIPVNQYADAANSGFGIPYPVRLDSDRVMIFFLPHYQHLQGDFSDFMDGEQIHTQIIEYDNGRFRAGPINTHLLPTQVYNAITYSLWSQPQSIADSWNQSNWRAVALSPTKVVAAYRLGNDFRLMRFTITGNVVDTSTVNLDLTGASYFNTTTARAFDLAIVPDDTDQVLVGGWADTNWSLQAFSVPDTGALASVTTLTSTGISNSSYHFSLCEMVKTATANVTPYIIAGTIDSNSAQVVIYNYNSANNTLAVSGSALALNDASGTWRGVQCECVSNDTNPNAVVAVIDSGNDQQMTFYPQQNASTAFNNSQTLQLQHSSNKSITESYRWGDERAVFIGDSQLLAVYDSAGFTTNLHPPEETVATERVQQQWYPFDSKPLYNEYDPASIKLERDTQYYSRKSVIDSTSVGEKDDLGTYCPMGFDRGMCYAWNENASCWIIGHHGRLYAMDTNGTILGEKSLYDLDYNLDYDQRVGDLVCTPSGRILFSTQYRIGSFPDTTYRPNSRWDNYSAGSGWLLVTEPLHSGNDLELIKLEETPVAFTNSHLTANLATFYDVTTNKECAYAMGIGTTGNQTGYVSKWIEGTQNWTYFTSIGWSSADGASAWFRGYHVNRKLIQDTPSSEAYPEGLWRVVGSYQWSNADNTNRIGISRAYPESQFSSIDPDNIYVSDEPNGADDTNGQGYGISLHRYNSGDRSGITVATMYDPKIERMRIWTTINGRLNYTHGYISPIESASHAYAKTAVSKFGYAVALQNTSTADTIAVALVFDNKDVTQPYATLQADSGHGFLTATAVNKNTWQVFGPGIDKLYRSAGIPDTVKFFLKLNDGNGVDFYLNNGQRLELIEENTSLFRSNDLYHIPPGYSVELRCDTPDTITTMLSIKEFV